MRLVRGSYLPTRSSGAWGALLLAALIAVLATPVAAHADDCPNAEIRQQQGVTDMPACMALEMVSPPAKSNQPVEDPMLSADGERLRYSSKASLGETPGLLAPLGDVYVSNRGEAGWTTVATAPPVEFAGSDSLRPQVFARDLGRWVWMVSTSSQQALGQLSIFEGGMGDAWLARSPLLVPTDLGVRNDKNAVETWTRGTSADLSHVLFSVGDELMASTSSPTYLPGDPVTSGASEGVRAANIYVASPGPGGEPSLELLTRDGEGIVHGGRCGAWLGGPSLPNQRRGNVNQGAVSADGSRMFLSTRVDQPSTGVCDAANKLRIMTRLEAPDGPEIAELITSECARVVPACDVTDGDDNFQGASVDGTKIFFTTTRQLADSDLDTGTACSPSIAASQGCDLYLYDATRPVGNRLTQVSAGDSGSPTPGSGADVLSEITAISGDGSHVYYVAKGVLAADPNSVGATAAPGALNLYVYQRDAAHPAGRTAFIGALDSACTDNANSTSSDCNTLFGAGKSYSAHVTAVPMTGVDDQGTEVGGDGHVLVFMSTAPLTPDDTDGLQRDVFRYDSRTAEIERISKAVPGGSDNGPYPVLHRFRVVPGADFAETYRWVSEDGEKILFRTREQLTPDPKQNGHYYWRNGQLFELPGLVDVVVDNNAPSASMSHSGDEIAYATDETLLPQDGDVAPDAYVLRVDGGFPFRHSPTACDPLTDRCQGSGQGHLTAPIETGKEGTGNRPAGVRGRIALRKLSAAQRAALTDGRSVRLAVRVNRPGRVRIAGHVRVGGSSLRVLSSTRVATRRGLVSLPIRLSSAGRGRLASAGRLRIALVARFSGVVKPVRTRLTLVRAVKKDNVKPNRGGVR